MMKTEEGLAMIGGHVDEATWFAYEFSVSKSSSRNQ